MYSRNSDSLLYFLIVIMLFVLVVVLVKDNRGLNGELSRQKKYTIYLGVNDKDTHKQEIPTEVRLVQ